MKTKKATSDLIMENIAVYDELKHAGYSEGVIDRVERAVNSHEDMLDVLKRAKRVVAESCGYNDGVRFHTDLLNDIEAAIVLAEGK